MLPWGLTPAALLLFGNVELKQTDEFATGANLNGQSCYTTRKRPGVDCSARESRQCNRRADPVSQQQRAAFGESANW